MRRTLGLLATAALLTAALPATAAAGGGPPRGKDLCERTTSLRVPGAEHAQRACLDDLTTSGLLDGDYRTTNPLNGVHTDVSDFANLHAPGTVNPTGVPGVQVDGYFSDTSTTNTLHGWNHDSQFVIRLPERWNGRIVVAGAPGVRRQYSSDFLVSDHVLAKGYAYASIDKGNTGPFFFRDGAEPGDAIREWHARTTQVARAAQRVVRQAYGRPAARTYMTGVSNGGYLTRWQLENRPGVFDGGVDSEGTLFETDSTLLSSLPPALRAYPTYRDGTGAAKEAARQDILAAGFEPGSEPLWDLHYRIYWDLTQRIYREELDPTFDGALEASITPTCPLTGEGSLGCAQDIGYDPSTRSAQLDEALRGITLTGKLKRPMLSLHGTLDTLLPIDLHAERYAELVAERHRSRLHRAYEVEGGQHVDGFVPLFPELSLRPLLPCHREALDALVAWVERGVRPPASGPVEPAGDDATNVCTL